MISILRVVHDHFDFSVTVQGLAKEDSRSFLKLFKRGFVLQVYNSTQLNRELRTQVSDTSKSAS